MVSAKGNECEILIECAASINACRRESSSARIIQFVNRAGNIADATNTRVGIYHGACQTVPLWTKCLFQILFLTVLYLSVISACGVIPVLSKGVGRGTWQACRFHLLVLLDRWQVLLSDCLNPSIDYDELNECPLATTAVADKLII